MNDPNRPVTGYPAAGVPPPNPNGYGGSAHQQPPLGTAYPYAAPPPSSAAYYHNNPYYQPNPYAAQRTTFLRRVIGIAIASMVIAGTFVFILWLVLRPRLPEFRVDSMSVSNLNLTNSLISANWDLRFTVRNPNKKMTLYYDDVAAAVFYDDVSLSDTTVPPFFQDKRVETIQKASFATAGAYVDNRFFDMMNKERSRRGAIGFNVRMVARVRFKAGAWRARRRFVRVYCKDLSVGVGSKNSSGTLLGGARQCRVGV
ncbi:NDR1/HIN1-like protein 10 [Solanum dulcamara]|uniref:NDR1/HIN1-like protein 10 n=1 Tax=Solanum dulcamara TaxID=45834 RepID=UPI002485DFA0|nr:NDR1/HIN1-like protein 10 [Solanum dulcamara]XP_055835557.1 NDR1/HIN1-like protein 10 [Solanum dulcamara]XP_055835558.1 NDR1/HIN1-like protein 10 [Solanum dulcamara]